MMITNPVTENISVCFALITIFGFPAAVKYSIPDITKPIIATRPAIDNKKTKTFIRILSILGAFVMEPAACAICIPKKSITFLVGTNPISIFCIRGKIYTPWTKTQSQILARERGANTHVHFNSHIKSTGFFLCNTKLL